MIRSIALAALAAGVLVSVSACDNGPSAVEPRARVEVADQREYYGEPEGRPAPAKARRTRAEADTPQWQGRPLWSASARYGAEENARRAFARNGEALGARSYEDFLDRVHAFVRKPPKGVLTLERANGDRLMYDPKGNLFAVVTRDGAPRTLFKPDEGMAYWERQVAREARRTPKDAETQDG